MAPVTLFENKPVIVYQFIDVDEADGMVRKFQDLGESPYVAQYNGRAILEDNHYIFVENPSSLKQYTEVQFAKKGLTLKTAKKGVTPAYLEYLDKRFNRVNNWVIDLFSDFFKGLRYIHNLGFVHGSISVHNLLIFECKDGSIRGKIGGLHTATYCFPNQKLRKNYTTSIGPEDSYAIGVKNDLMKLSSIIYYALEHLHIQIDDDMQYKIPDSKKERIVCYPEVFNLISNIQNDDLTTAEDILGHPFFWDADKRINFLKECSDRIVLYNPDDCPDDSPDDLSPDIREIQTGDLPPDILETQNKKTLKDTINEDLGNEYNGWKQRMMGECYATEFYNSWDKKPTDLLRTIRNKSAHRQEIPPYFYKEVKNIIGLGNNLEPFFRNYFPNFLINVYQSSKSILRGDMFFKKYFVWMD